MRRKCFWVSFPHCLFCLIEFHFISSHNFMSTCCSMGLDVVLSFLCSFVVPPVTKTAQLWKSQWPGQQILRKSQNGEKFLNTSVYSLLDCFSCYLALTFYWEESEILIWKRKVEKPRGKSSKTSYKQVKPRILLKENMINLLQRLLESRTL